MAAPEAKRPPRYTLPYDRVDRSANVQTTSRCVFCDERFVGLEPDALEWSRKHRLRHRHDGVPRA